MTTIDAQAVSVPENEAEAPNPIPFMQPMGQASNVPSPPKISFTSLDEKLHRNNQLSKAAEYGLYFFGGLLLGQVAHAYAFPSILLLTVPACLFVSRDVVIGLLNQWAHLRYLRGADGWRMAVTLGYLPCVIILSVVLGYFFF